MMGESKYRVWLRVRVAWVSPRADAVFLSSVLMMRVVMHNRDRADDGDDALRIVASHVVKLLTSSCPGLKKKKRNNMCKASAFFS